MTDPTPVPVRVAVALLRPHPDGAVAVVPSGGLPGAWLAPGDDPAGVATRLLAWLLGCSPGDWCRPLAVPPVVESLGGVLRLTYAAMAPAGAEPAGASWVPVGRLLADDPPAAAPVAALLRSL
jgi:hypothetical protein